METFNHGHITSVLQEIGDKDRKTIYSIFEKYNISTPNNNGKDTPEPECNDADKENMPNPVLCKLATHKGYTSKRKLKALTMEQIEADLVEGCDCKEKCLTHDDLYCVLRWREKYHLSTQGFSQQKKLFDIFRETKCLDGTGTEHIIEGRRICRMAFYKVLMKISERTYFRIQKAVKSGIEYLVKKPHKVPNGDRGMIAVGYMSCIVAMMGDKSPENDRILLPPGLIVKEIYNRYKLIYSDKSTSIEEKRFYGLWKEHFSNVTHQQRNSNFSTCNVCLMAKEVLEGQHPPEVHQATRQEWDEHLSRQQKERISYYSRRNEAIQQPQSKLSLIIDGMDQSKTNIPHFQGWQVPKACDRSKQLKTHITGVLVHGKTTYSFLDLQQWAHDSNLTLNCLLYVLCKEAKDGHLPKTLYVQLDNCFRENKNKYFMGMMALLVLKGYFDEVWMSFLMVGHTHEDVDARFSKISAKLKLNAAKTLPELEGIIKSSINLGMTSILMPKIYNIRDWLQPCLNEIHNHSLPHIYRFQKDRANHVSVKYKDWSTDAEWKPGPTEEQIELIKINPNGDYKLPEGIPLEIYPDIESNQDMGKIKDNIRNVKPFLNFSQAKWWDDFFENPISSSGYDSNVIWYLNRLKCQTEEETENMPTELSPSPLAMYMNKERCIKRVYSGKRKALSALEKEDDAKRKQLLPGSGFLIMFQDDDQEIGIGAVNAIGENKLTVHLYQGCLHGEWALAKDGRGHIIERDIVKTWLISGMIFQLTERKCLPIKVKNVLKQYI